MEIAIVLLTALAAVFSVLSFLKRPPSAGLSYEQAALLIGNEGNQNRQAGEEQARGLRQELGNRLDTGIKTIDDKVGQIGAKLEKSFAQLGQDAETGRDKLRLVVENKLEGAATRQSEAAKTLREEIHQSFQRSNTTLGETLTQFGAHQKERLDKVATNVSELTGKIEKAQETLRQTVEGRLDTLRAENSAKLDDMRKTVDEKLQTTLETRLGDSFNRVVEQLERVHKGIGEMRTLATGVGDLKKVLSNVKVRGTFGEIQVGALLEQFLSPEQYVKNAQVKEGSAERVEFAIKLPGRDSEHEVLLAVDAKFPLEDYEKLVAASEAGDAEGVAVATKAIESRIRACAKEIRGKYIDPPRTTDFAVLYLPTESLYCEVLRRPGLFDDLQREFHVTLTGPVTFTAYLNALQMGFRSLAIEKRSSEVWQILGAVKNEFQKYNEVVEGLGDHLRRAVNSVEKLGTRARVMDKKLRNVERASDTSAQLLLNQTSDETDSGDDDVVTVLPLRLTKD
jgi:DNA recombination protein RmuC